MNMFSHSILASLQCHLDLTCHVGFHIIYRPYENVSGNRELCKICMIQLYSLNTAWNIPTLSQPLCKSLFRKNSTMLEKTSESFILIYQRILKQLVGWNNGHISVKTGFLVKCFRLGNLGKDLAMSRRAWWRSPKWQLPLLQTSHLATSSRAFGRRWSALTWNLNLIQHLEPIWGLNLTFFLKASKTFIRPILMFWGLPKKQSICHEIPKRTILYQKFQEFPQIWRVFYKSYGSQSLWHSDCVPVSKNSWTPIELWIHWNSHLPRFPGRRFSFFCLNMKTKYPKILNTPRNLWILGFTTNY